MTQKQQLLRYVASAAALGCKTCRNTRAKRSWPTCAAAWAVRPATCQNCGGAFLQEMPEELQSPTGAATGAEWAIYLTLTLYALHQQGQTSPMHKQGEGLGKAARLLVPARAGTRRKQHPKTLQRAGHCHTDAGTFPPSARDGPAAARRRGIPLDYIQLAADFV